MNKTTLEMRFVREEQKSYAEKFEHGEKSILVELDDVRIAYGDTVYWLLTKGSGMVEIRTDDKGNRSIIEK